MQKPLSQKVGYFQLSWIPSNCSVVLPPPSQIRQFPSCCHVSLTSKSRIRLATASGQKHWMFYQQRLHGGLNWLLLSTLLHSLFFMHTARTVTQFSFRHKHTCHCSFSCLPPSIPPFTSWPDYWLMITCGTLSQLGPVMLVKPSCQLPQCCLWQRTSWLGLPRGWLGVKDASPVCTSLDR